MIFDVMKYGAIGDGKANDGKAIQASIDACTKDGGGRVLLPGGHTYKTGSLVLKSGVDFHLESGAILKASENSDDYAKMPKGLPTLLAKQPMAVPSYVNCEYDGIPDNYFLYAKDERNICISGMGRIDGTEEMWYGDQNTYHIEGICYPRIPILFLEHVTQLTIKDVTLSRSGFWTLQMVGCEDVLVDGIRILNSLKMANCDGIDPDRCRNVRIANCHIECADDCIVLKCSHAYRKYGSCENIQISGCTLTSTSAALKIGTESEGDFRNIVAENCTISRTNRGIALQLRDCGNIENAIFANINVETRRFSDQWWGKAEPIYVTAINRKKGVKAGCIRNIHFQNINCVSENGIFLCGNPDSILDDITFDRVRVTLRRASKWPMNTCDLRPCEGNGLYQTKVNGFYSKYAKNIDCRDVKIICDDSAKDAFGKEFEMFQ
jgi:polygalacturonase